MTKCEYVGKGRIVGNIGGGGYGDGCCLAQNTCCRCRALSTIVRLWNITCTTNLLIFQTRAFGLNTKGNLDLGSESESQMRVTIGLC